MTEHQSDPRILNNLSMSSFSPVMNSRSLEILDNVSDAVLVMDQEWRVVFANKQACILNQTDLAAFLGKTHWEAWPPSVGTEIERQYRRSMKEQVDVHFEFHYAFDPYDIWLEVDTYPSLSGLSIFYRDISARKSAERTLRDSETRFRALAENIAQLAWIADASGWIFWYNKRWFDYTGTTLEQMQGWGWSEVHHPDHLARVTEKWSAHLPQGLPWEDTFPLRGKDGQYRWFLSRANPTFDDNGNVLLWCGTNTDITEQRATEEKLRSRVDREALLNRIGLSIRRMDDPVEIEALAVRALGEILGVDRCYFASVDELADYFRIGPDFRRDSLPVLTGEYALSVFNFDLQAVFPDGKSIVVPDVKSYFTNPVTARALSEMSISAVIGVPFFNGGRVVAVLSAGMAAQSREWTEDEVALCEAVGLLLHTGIESVKNSLRERKITEQLKSALQPATPIQVPGLLLAEYYRPALADQGVGGDFSDVFSTDKGVTYLVVGDLSGKGIAAASQVAMVRHMLRFALYNGRTVAGPVGSVNSTLAEHGLLTGFSTLFVGRYDASNRELTYVNCGQDPGLILRHGTGAIETLSPTGPVVGLDSNGVYTEEVVTLQFGDVIAVFTDGLTEAGPTRMTLLTGEGVAQLLAHEVQTPDSEPQAIVERLIAGVDAYAGHGVRDDQCLLVGRVV